LFQPSPAPREIGLISEALGGIVGVMCRDRETFELSASISAPEKKLNMCSINYIMAKLKKEHFLSF
jgi:hypothetical protein